MNKLRTSSDRKHQQGASLIALMVGMLVSMLSILAVMSMHKSLIGVAVESKQDSIHDGLINSVLVQLQSSLHNAGFGIDTATANDVITVAANGSSALYWRFSDTTVRCVGIRDVAFTDPETQLTGRRLAMVSVDSGCTETANLADLDWAGGTETLLATFRGEGYTTTDPLFSFTARQAVCTPFGFGEATDHMEVAVVAQSSALINGATAVSDIEYKYCLANTHFN